MPVGVHEAWQQAQRRQQAHHARAARAEGEGHFHKFSFGMSEQAAQIDLWGYPWQGGGEV